MTTADYALIISLVSLLMAVFSLIWNVWQKFIFVKPALHVSFGSYNLLQPKTSGSLGPSTGRYANAPDTALIGAADRVSLRLAQALG
jgi:hypothetical protein